MARAAYLETLGLLFGNSFALVPQNPYYNLLWQITEGSTMYPDEIAIPMLHIGGWFDHNTEATLTMFDTLQQVSPAAADQRLLMGPWTHGGTGPSSIGTSVQGDLNFPEAAGYHNTIANQFLAYHLLDEDNGWQDSAPVQFFQMGTNTWQERESWPPEALETETFYLTSQHELVEVAVGLDTMLRLRYDPTDPSPTIGGKTLHPDLLQGPYDQSAEVESRDDALIFTSGVLENALTVLGQVRAHLFVQSDREDTDLVLRLTEVYPDGQSILLGETNLRLRFRNGFRQSDEEFMEESNIYPITMEFDNLANTFQAGNRIRLIITSSNYPRLNRNMNTGEEMYPENNLDTLVNPLIATNLIRVQGIYPSRLELPVEHGAVATVRPDVIELAMHPHPANDFIRVDGLEQGASITIFTLSGRAVLRMPHLPADRMINISHIPAGIFVLRVKSHEASGSRLLTILR